MAKSPPSDPDEAPALGRDPLAEDEEILARTFYHPAPAPGDTPSQPLGRRPRATRGKRSSRTTTPRKHYKVVSISLYNEDIERLDALVEGLKQRGHTKANRSALIRYALDTVDISKMPRSY